MAHVVTAKTNMVVPEVMASALEQKMIDYIKLSPLAVINTDLQGNGGDTITVPYYSYIGDATDLAENTGGEANLLSATTITATVKKIFKAVEITDEALLSNFGSPLAEIEKQLAMAMASKVEADCYAVLQSSTNTVDLSATNSEEISTSKISEGAVALFGEDLEGIFCFVTPAQYNRIRTSSEFVHVANGQVVITGHVGQVYGVNIVVSNRATNGTNIMMKYGALQISVKRGVLVETDRDILKKTTVISADRHYVAHILDANKVGVMTVKAS
jgi:N4-gp56 family major capsid protein